MVAIMASLGAFVQAARLRTLPLSISGVLVGAAVALKWEAFDVSILILALTTTILLQILSNFANDYGDGVKGTDQNRVGEQRAVSSGMISAGDMRMAIILLVALAFISGFSLIYLALGFDPFLRFFLFLITGILAIIAAIKYTVGKNAYGYKAKGDFYVFIFFGLVSCIGTYFLMTESWNAPLLLPACTVGLWSMAVLNLNNMRDRITDKEHGKITIAVLLGENNSKTYHISLLSIGALSALIYLLLMSNHFLEYIALVALIPIALHVFRVLKISSPENYDPELKVVALSTFLFSLLLFLGQYAN